MLYSKILVGRHHSCFVSSVAGSSQRGSQSGYDCPAHRSGRGYRGSVLVGGCLWLLDSSILNHTDRLVQTGHRCHSTNRPYTPHSLSALYYQYDLNKNNHQIILNT